MAADLPQHTHKRMEEINTPLYVDMSAWLRKHGKV